MFLRLRWSLALDDMPADSAIAVWKACDLKGWKHLSPWQQVLVSRSCGGCAGCLLRGGLGSSVCLFGMLQVTLDAHKVCKVTFECLNASRHWCGCLMPSTVSLTQISFIAEQVLDRHHIPMPQQIGVYYPVARRDRERYGVGDHWPHPARYE